MATKSTYRRLLTQSFEQLQAKLTTLAEQELTSKSGSATRRKLLRLIRKELHRRNKQAALLAETPAALNAPPATGANGRITVS